MRILRRQCTRMFMYSSTQILSYQKRLSGPLLDRIDMVVNVSRVPNNELLKENELNKKQHHKALNIINLTTRQKHNRYNSSIKNNNNLSNEDLRQSLALSPAVRQLLAAASDQLNLSARSYFKVIKRS